MKTNSDIVNIEDIKIEVTDDINVNYIKNEVEENQETDLMIEETIAGMNNTEEAEIEALELCDNVSKLVGIDLLDWLQDIYPELYKLWKETSNNTEASVSEHICSICKIKEVEGVVYGVGMCEADRHFIKRTFYKKIRYQPCQETCPTRARGWCKFCRLKAVLSTPLDIEYIGFRRKEMLDNRQKDERKLLEKLLDESTNKCKIIQICNETYGQGKTGAKQYEENSLNVEQKKEMINQEKETRSGKQKS